MTLTTSGFYMLRPERMLPAADAELWLGRVVRSPGEPEACYAPEDPTPFIAPSRATTTIMSEAVVATRASKSRSIGMGIDSTVEGTRGTHDVGAAHLESQEVRCVGLGGHVSVLARAWADADAQRELLDVVSPRGRRCWMVVGVMVAADAQIAHARGRAVEYSTNMSIPLAAIAPSLASGVAEEVQKALPSFNAARSSSTEAAMTATARGEMIVGLRYREVVLPRMGRLVASRDRLILGDRGPRIEEHDAIEAPQAVAAGLALEGGEGQRLEWWRRLWRRAEARPAIEVRPATDPALTGPGGILLLPAPETPSVRGALDANIDVMVAGNAIAPESAISQTIQIPDPAPAAAVSRKAPAPAPTALTPVLA
jgi:hypothetical protein